jgi:Uma2 family endonuclease
MSTTVSPSRPTEAQEPKVVSRRGTPTWEIAYLYPEQGAWTEEDYLALNTNRLIELSDGCLEFLPMPTLPHQFILEFLFDELRAFLKRSGTGGRASFAPVPVRLRKDKYREPDLFYLLPERMKKGMKYPDGVDLAVEIVSGGAEDRKRDFETKPQEYAEAGISEYWIVDPEHRTITVLTLDGKTYRVHGEFGPGKSATSVLLDGFAVSVDETFAAGESLEEASKE